VTKAPSTEVKPTGGDENKSTKHKESFVRWQSVTVAELGYVINLVLTFAVAALGFSFALLKDKDFLPLHSAKCFFTLALILLLVSVLLGIACAANRLWDFRKTTAIARDREQWTRDGQMIDQIDSMLKDRREDTTRLGKRTWRLFGWQIVTFAGGVLSLTVAFMIYYWKFLF
jgi:hypothetical protein